MTTEQTPQRYAVNPDDINWPLLAARLRDAENALIHREGGRLYGEAFHTEALRRAILPGGTGLTTEAYLRREVSESQSLLQLHHDQLKAALAEARKAERAERNTVRRECAEFIRSYAVHAKGTYRNQGMQEAADWIDPDKSGFGMER